MERQHCTYFFILFFLTLVLPSRAISIQQAEIDIKGSVINKRTKEPIPFLSISILGEQTYKTTTDESGSFYFNRIPASSYQLVIQSIHYESQRLAINAQDNPSIVLELEPIVRALDEVYVTAAESNGLTSSSIINREAVQLLQPSSFTDLLSLLPGGRAENPDLTNMNRIRLRETGAANSQYDISSLGTAFYIDGAPINTNANMQTTNGFTLSDPNGTRDATNKGVDMRTISTDQIESVEIIRGIPSAMYGDLTSGVVKIERKKGTSPFYARIKADGFSKLLAVGKGIYLPTKQRYLNLDLGYLDAKADPTDNFQRYKRLSASLRTEKTWQYGTHEISWSTALDYSGNIDHIKADPDLDYAPTDTYRSSNSNYGLSNNVHFKFNPDRFLKSLTISSKINYQRDQINLTKWMQAGTASILYNSLEEGEHDAGYLTPSYTAHLSVDGQPLNAFAKVIGNATYHLLRSMQQFNFGAEYNYSKNFGEGQVYDLDFPPSPSIGVRPRSFRSIPAQQNLSIFAENTGYFNLGDHRLTLATGLRSTGLVGLGDRYALHNRLYIDPRINGKWQLPLFDLGHRRLSLTLGAGYGLQTKFPTLNQLYPNLLYEDLVQLNFYHDNPAYRKANVMTYIIDPTNDQLHSAVNKKWEFNLDINYQENRFSITYFRETMHSGFRNSSQYQALAFKQYDITSIDGANLTAPPNLTDFTYVDTKEYYGYMITSNGSSLLKEGIEYQFTSRRLSSINTRITVNGAWLKSRYHNSNLLYQVIDRNIVTDGGKYRQYVGIYNDVEGSIAQQLNTNLTLDSYLPKLGLSFMTSVQSLWFTSRQQEPTTGMPIQYIDINGTIHPYTEEDTRDANLQGLYTPVNTVNFRKYTVPIDLQINIKASKTFNKKVTASMFVNRLLSYTPNYDSYGMQVIRSGSYSPYFGMELTFNF